MKLLIATTGNSLDSLIAPSADAADWFLIVDSVTREVTPVRTLGQPAADVLTGAVDHGITIFLTGSETDHSRLTIAAGLTSVAFSQQITAAEALERWISGQIE